MKVVSLVRESVASPRTGYDKSALAAPGFGGELLRRAIWQMMDDNVRTNRHGALKRHSWPSAEDSPLQASPYVTPGRGVHPRSLLRNALHSLRSAL